jgi:urocanate hydratase
VARRAWARNPHAMETARRFNSARAGSEHITLPFVADEELIHTLLGKP